MPAFDISMNGHTYTVNGPDGYTAQQAYTDLTNSLGQGQQQPQQDEFGSAVDAAYGSKDATPQASDNMLSTDGSQQAAPDQQQQNPAVVNGVYDPTKDAKNYSGGAVGQGTYTAPPMAEDASKGFWNNIKIPGIDNPWWRGHDMSVRAPDNQKVIPGASSGLASVASIATGAPTDKERFDAATKANPNFNTTPQMKEIGDALNQMYENGQSGTPEYKALEVQYDKERQWNNDITGPLSDTHIQDIPSQVSSMVRDWTQHPLDKADETFVQPIAAIRRGLRDDPGGTIANLVNAFEGDPEYLRVPGVGWDLGALRVAELMGRALEVSKIAKAFPATTRVAKATAGVAGGMVGTGMVGAAVQAPISVAEQLQTNGSIDLAELGQDMTNAGVAMATFSGLSKGFSSFAKVALGVDRLTPEAIMETLKENSINGQGLQQSVNSILDSFGISHGTAAADEAALHMKVGAVEEINNFYNDAAKVLGGRGGSGAESWDINRISRSGADEVTAEEFNKFATENAPAGPSGIGQQGEGGDVNLHGSGAEPMSEAEAAAFQGSEKPSVLGQDTSGAEGGDVSPIGFQKGRPISPSEYQRTADRWNKQSGKVDQRLLGALGLTGVGAAGAFLVGANADDLGKYAGWALATAGAAFLARKPLAKFVTGAIEIGKTIAKNEEGYRIDNMLNPYERNLNGQRFSNLKLNMLLKQMLPDKDRLPIITRYMEGEKSLALSPVEKEAVRIMQEAWDNSGKLALEHGVIKEMKDNYVTHIFEPDIRSNASKLEAFLDSAKSTGMNMSGKSQFGMDRFFQTYKDALEIKGLKPRYEHPADILRAYLDNIHTAIENKKLLNVLKNTTFLDGKRPIMPSKKAPDFWGSLNHPQLTGYKIHPDIMPSLRHFFSYHQPGLIFRALRAVNFAAKRAIVSASAFHLNALAESAVYAGMNPVTAFRLGQKMMMEGKQIVINGKAISYNGKLADAVDILVRNGLKFGTEDIGAPFHENLIRGLGKVADDIVPLGNLGSKAAGGIIKFTQTMDHLTWDMAHTGLKVSLGVKELEKMILRNLDDHTKNGAPLKSLDEMAANVSSYVNDIAGGLDWRRAAEGIQNKLGRRLALDAFSPVGRQWMQMLLFAPDWTISNIRAAVKAIPGVTNSDIARLHRFYVLRGAVIYGTVFNAINMHFNNGKFIWQNDDPTMIDLGDGRHLLPSKHFTEVYRWLPFIGKPLQETLNKLAFFPKELGSLLLNRQYLSSSSKSPPIWRDTDSNAKKVGKYGLHLASQFTPITGQQFANQGTQGVAGFLGHPIYGRTEEQKAQAQMAKDMDFSTAVDNMFNQSMGK